MSENTNEINSSPLTAVQVPWVTQLRENSPKLMIPIDLVYNPNVLNGDDILLGAGGYGEELLGAAEGVRKFGELAINSAFMVHPFDKKKVPAADDAELRLWVEKILIETPVFVASWLNEQAGRPVDAPIDSFGRSMSGGGNAMSVARAPERFNIVEIQAPAGINDHSIDIPEKKRIRQFLGTMGANMAKPEQNSFKDRRNVTAGFEIGKRALIDVLQKRFNTKVGYAVSANIAPDISKIHKLKGEDFGLWLGSNDPVVQLTQIQRLLNVYSREHNEEDLADIIRVYDGSHTSLYANGIRSQLKPIGEHIHERRKAS